MDRPPDLPTGFASAVEAPGLPSKRHQALSCSLREFKLTKFTRVKKWVCATKKARAEMYLR